MADIKILDNGPLIVSGEAKLTDSEGKEFKVEGNTALCRCGGSANKPFCDGAHKGKFESAPRAE